MPNNNTATIFGPKCSMSPTSDNAIGFCQPMFEDIFLFSSELAASIVRPPYYGDQINLGFWEKLNMDYGVVNSNIKIVCIGNSLTYGAGGGPGTPSNPTDGGGGINWPDKWAGLTGYIIINKGINSDTSGQMLARFNSDVISLSPDYCIIECGTNDAIQGVSIADCKANIQAMISLCLANGIKPRLVHYIQRYNQMQLALNAGLYTFNPTYVYNYLTDIWNYIQGLGYPCVLLNYITDVDALNANMYYFYNTLNDYIHPGPDGYIQWAYYIAQKFNDIKTSSLTNSIYTLRKGWKYKYYYTQKRFIVLDENDYIVYDSYNITKVSQFPIDYSVHKSHQFEIIIGDASEMSTFYINAELVKREYGDSPTVNNGKLPVINNVYLPNRGEFSNYFSQMIEPSRGDSYMEYTVIPNYRFIKYPSTIGGVMGNIGVDFYHKGIPSSMVYNDDFVPFKAVKEPITFRTMMLKYSWLLAIMGLTMFPALEPILRQGETQNNRPLYEPWLIWGVMKYLGNHEYGGPGYPWDDEDTPRIDVLDAISPNWSY